MWSFLIHNWVTIVVLLVLAVVVVLAVSKIVKDKKAGVGACGCKCTDCPHASACHRY